MCWRGSPARAAGRPRAHHRAASCWPAPGAAARAINRGLLVVGLLLAFGVNLGIFTATYDQQANVDAQLTLGADVTATRRARGRRRPQHLQRKIAAVPGVRATTRGRPLLRVCRPDLQDTFGIDASTISAATTLRDSYFIGAGAQQTLARLRSRRDGILVSKETIADYQLKLGDLLNLRVLDHRTGQLPRGPVPRRGHRAGVPLGARATRSWSPTSRYLQAADHAGGPNVVFAKRERPARPRRRAIARATRADGTIVKNIAQQAQQTVSSITTVDLRGISQHRGGLHDRAGGRGDGAVLRARR